MFKTFFVVLIAFVALIVAVVCCNWIGYASAAPKTTTLAISGMTCATCPIAVKKALSRVDGVTAVEVSFEKKEAMVSFDDAKANTQALVQATENAGFTSTVKQ